MRMRFLNATLICLLIAGFTSMSAVEGFQSSSEGINPFNEFMNPSGGVSLFSGGAAFSYPLGSVKGRGGADYFPLNLLYSSNIMINARSRSDISPTGWAGLGWNLGFGSVRCFSNGTKTHDDDIFMWISTEGVPSKLVRPNKMIYTYREFDHALSNLAAAWGTGATGFTEKSGFCEYFNIRQFDQLLHFAYQFETKIDLPAEGDYTFYTESDDGSELEVDGDVIVHNDNVHPLQLQWNATPKHLTAGKHTLKVRYFQNETNYKLNVYYLDRKDDFNTDNDLRMKTIKNLPIFQLSCPGADIDGNKQFYAERSPQTRFEPQIDGDGVCRGWIVTTADGTKYLYGNLDPNLDQKATRYTFSCGDYVGPVYSTPVGATLSLYPTQWDLSAIRTTKGDTTTLWYTQETEELHTGSFSSAPLAYTKASYVARIQTPGGGKAVFSVAEKKNGSDQEWVDPHTENPEPDGFMELYEKQRLDAVYLFLPGTETPVSSFKFTYDFLNKGKQGYLKSLLTGITEYQGSVQDAGHLYRKTTFAYYDDFSKSDGYDPDYNYGALKEVRKLETGAVTRYTYSLDKQDNPGNFYKSGDSKGQIPGAMFGVDGVELIGGSYDKGKEYIIAKGGDKQDRLWMYTFDGHSWNLDPRFNCWNPTSQEEKQVVTGEDAFLYKNLEWAIGNQIQLFSWVNNRWSLEDVSFRQNSNQQVLTASFSNDFLVMSGKDWDLDSKYKNGWAWIYRKYGDRWLLDNTISGRILGDVSNDDKINLHIATGNNFFAAVEPHGEVVPKLPTDPYDHGIFRWNGKEWLNANHVTFANADGAGYKFFDVYAGPNYLVFTADKDSDDPHWAHYLWMFYWDGSKWAPNTNFGVNGFLNVHPGQSNAGVEFYWDAAVIPGNDYVIIKEQNPTWQKILINKWNGQTWNQEVLYDPSPSNAPQFTVSEIIPGADYIAVCGAPRGRDIYNLLRLYRKNSGGNWDLDKSLTGGSSEWWEFAGIQSNFTLRPGNKSFAISSLGTTDDPVSCKIFSDDGTVWRESYSKTFDGKIQRKSGAYNSPCATHSGFGFSAFIPYNDNTGSKGRVEVNFLHKYQDQFEYVRNYVVAKKEILPDADKILSTSYQYMSSNTDAYAGTPKYGQVSIVSPQIGKTFQYFWNHSKDIFMDPLKYPNPKDMDGKVFRTIGYSSENKVVSDAVTNYNQFKLGHWPQGVVVTQVAHTMSSVNGSLSTGTVTENWVDGFNAVNGLPQVERTVNSNGMVTLKYAKFAFEEPQYASMGVNGAHMLTQPCQVSSHGGYEPAAYIQNGTYTVSPPQNEIAINLSSDQLAAIKEGDSVSVSFGAMASAKTETPECFLHYSNTYDYSVGRVEMKTTDGGYRIGWRINHAPVSSLAFGFRGFFNALTVKNIRVDFYFGHRADNAFASTVNLWNYSNNIWQPCSSFSWNIPLNKQGLPEAGNALAAFDFSSGAVNDTRWKFNGSPTRNNSYNMMVEALSASHLYSSAIFGTPAALLVASVANARFDECGVLTGDYDDGANPDYFDYQNAWEKAGAVLDDGTALWGQNSMKTVDCFGPTRNFKVYPNTDYIFSAWVRVSAKTSADQKLVMWGDYRKLKPGAPEVMPFDLGDAEIVPFSVPPKTVDAPASADAEKWQLIKLKIPASKDVSGADWYTRVFVGTPPGLAGGSGGTASLCDIRYYPEKAVVTSTYYDSKWLSPRVAIDANDHAGACISLDQFGRPAQSKLIDDAKNVNDPGFSTLIKEKRYHSLIQKMQLYSPHESETYYVKRSMSVEWAYEKSGAQVNIYLIPNGGEPVEIKHGANADEGRFIWDPIPASAAAVSCVIRIEDAGDQSIFAESKPFRILFVRDEIVSPANGMSWTAGTTQEIKWLLIRAKTVDIFYSADGGASYTGIFGNVACNDHDYNSVSWMLPNTGSGNAAARIKIVDADDASNFVESDAFTVVDRVNFIRRWVFHLLGRQ
jgi:hypothetical protein